MRFDAVTIDVPTASTRVQLSSVTGIEAEDRILWLRARGDPGNTGTVYIGIADVAATNGWSLENNDDIGLTIDFRTFDGSIPASDIWFDTATNGDDIECAIIFE